MTNRKAFITLKLGPTNIYLLRSRDGYLLIDTSYPAYLRPFLKKLERIQVDPAEVRHLLLTHSHDDHAGFAAQFRERTNCRLIVHQNAIESLRQGCIINVGRFLDWRARVAMTLYNWSKRRDFEYPPVILRDDDLVVQGDDEEILRSIGVEGRILYTPGHTDDLISVMLADGDAFVGDACMSNLGFLHYRPIEHSDPAQVFRSWEKIVESGARTIHPGHGKPFGVGELIRSKKRYAPSLGIG